MLGVECLPCEQAPSEVVLRYIRNQRHVIEIDNWSGTVSDNTVSSAAFHETKDVPAVYALPCDHTARDDDKALGNKMQQREGGV